MENKANAFNSGTEKIDIKLLERLLRETVPVTDRNGTRATYYIPLKPEYTDVCEFMFKKYGINMERYNSSMAPHPVLKITFAQIAQLPDAARNFLFSVHVDPKQLDTRLNQIMSEMQNQK